MLRRQSGRFLDREEAGRYLAEILERKTFHRPLVLAIPRGGVVIGAEVARALGAELDVVLARKLRAPHDPEIAIGAMAEDGEILLAAALRETAGADDAWVARERERCAREIELLERQYRAIRPRAPVAGRTVIVVDDGIATGSTMTAALRVVRDLRPRETIVAVPVADTAATAGIRPWCDEIVSLVTRAALRAIGDEYVKFDPVTDDEVVRLLSDERLVRPAAEDGDGGS
jgi:predicted phosphoribosyltransferase